MDNNFILDSIINYVKAMKSDGVILTQYGQKKIGIRSVKYLLNQTLRQLILSNDKYFISEKAKELWNKITEEPISNYSYRDKVIFTKDEPITIELYRGNESNSYDQKELTKGSSFLYREVFSDEHMVTIKSIIESLIKLEELNYKNVYAIIEKIHICRMLKEEDKRIKNKQNRSLDVEEVINNDYKEAKITVLKF